MPSERWCALRGPIDCRDCTLKAVCPYPYIFETAPFEGAQQLRTYGDVPRPFVIDPLDTRGEYRKGESFSFQLTIIGRAIDYLPYFLVSFRELGEMGIGKGRGRFQLTHVRTDNGESIYDGDTQMVHNLDNARSFDDIQRETESQKTDELTLRLLTPTRITYEGALTDQLPFHVFWRRLIGRISGAGVFPLRRIAGDGFQGIDREGNGCRDDGFDAALEGLDAVFVSAGPEDAARGVGGARHVCRGFGGVRSVCGVGRVSACGQKCNVWVGEVSGCKCPPMIFMEVLKYGLSSIQNKGCRIHAQTRLKENNRKTARF